MVQPYCSMDTYIASFSSIDYHHLLFYILGHANTIVTSYGNSWSKDSCMVGCAGGVGV